MAANYTEEQVEVMIAWYVAEPTRDTVDIIAKEMNKSTKSVIGKLSREGVYKKTVYKTKTGETPITKKELVEELASYLDISYNSIAGLEKSPKADLNTLVSTVRQGVHNAQESWEGNLGLFIETRSE